MSSLPAIQPPEVSSQLGEISQKILLTTEEAAAYTGMKPDTLEHWRFRGCGPRFIRMGSGRRAKVRYRRTDVEAWLHANTVETQN